MRNILLLLFTISCLGLFSYNTVPMNYKNLDVDIYPNPSSKFTYIKVNDPSDCATITIFNSSGVKIYSQQIATNVEVVMQKIAIGCYISKVETATNSTVKVLIIE
jgi:hypothetical protein